MSKLLSLQNETEKKDIFVSYLFLLILNTNITFSYTWAVSVINCDYSSEVIIYFLGSAKDR